VEVVALADTGALMLRIPEHVGVQLQLEQESLREVTVADGRVMQVPGVGPVRVADQGRSCFLGALVLVDSVWLGVVPRQNPCPESGERQPFSWSDSKVTTRPWGAIIMRFFGRRITSST